ncbi:MAG TPA: hypothetical protein VF796_01850, partial [Humisphaera sp.]
TAYTTLRDGRGDPVSGATMFFRLKAPAGTADSYERVDFAATSDADGLVQVPVLKASDYEARRGTRGDWTAFTTGTDDTYELPRTLGGYGR